MILPIIFTRRLSLMLAALVCLQIGLGSPGVAGQTIVSHQKIERSLDEYMIGLLKLALGYSDRNYEFNEASEPFSRARVVSLTQDGSLSVMWTGTSELMENTLHPIRIPAYKGLMGHRIFIIRQGDQARFDSINSLEELRQVRMGQGRTWADTAILEQASMRVVKTMKTEGLFHMLDGERFDAFPRGVHEPWSEVTQRPALNLVVESRLLIKYIMPYYFFPGSAETSLAQDLFEGLESAIADGSFDDYFFSSPDVQKALENANLHQRKVFDIPNPFLPKGTPIDRKELWLDIRKL